MIAIPVVIDSDTEDDPEDNTEDIFETESVRSPCEADSEQPTTSLSETSIIQLPVPSEVTGKFPHRSEHHEDISRQIDNIFEVARSQTPQSHVSEDNLNGSLTQAVPS